MSISAIEQRCQLMTGSSLDAAFGRGRYRGVATVTDDEFAFVSETGEEIVRDRLTDIAEVSFSRPGGITVKGPRKVKLFLDASDFGDRPETVVGDVGNAVLIAKVLGDFSNQFTQRWRVARSKANNA